MPGEPSTFARDRFALSTIIFVRLFALVHAIAFASALTQIPGLVGPNGIAPASAYFVAAREQLGPGATWQLPSLCWWFGTGKCLTVLGLIGIAASVLLFVGIAPVACLLVLWASYLSLVNAGQMFFGYQWDGLLLEATLLTVFIVPWRWRPLWNLEEPPKIARLLVWWLTFRLMFLAGVVKLASGDPTWRNLTALTFHYETQPLPTPLAWYAHQAPLWWHKAECFGTFVIELGLPFLLFFPRTARHVAAWGLSAFMVVVALTGNYTFFNLLAIVLCLYCLDDHAWARLLKLGAQATQETTEAPVATIASSDPVYPLAARSRRKRDVREWAAIVFGSFAFAFTGVLALLTVGVGVPPGFGVVARVVEPLRSFNNYGLFAVMTHPRPELVVAGSYDGRNWHEYDFAAKPGPLTKRPTFVAPLQPRLDWQLWFAALEPADQNPWLLSLCEHLLRGDPTTLQFLASNPFPDQPPKYVRVVRYEYHFTDAATRRSTDDWWSRTPTDMYVPPVSLR